ncbi:M48 family metallopeptidase [Patescibacteria group bacterium]
MEELNFKYGKYSYKYFLVRQTRKTISLTVKPNLIIILKCPIEYSEEKISKFLKRKWLWIEKQIAYFKKFQKKYSHKEYISGESFFYLGKQYKLVVNRAKFDKVSLKYGKIQVDTTKKVSNGRYNKKLLKEWYNKRILFIFNEQYNKVFKNFSCNFMPTLVIRKMNKRWGSFLSNKKIILNPDLIYSAKDCIAYVIIHELCHLKYKKHDKKFYRLLEMKINNWKSIKDKLELCQSAIS